MDEAAGCKKDIGKDKIKNKIKKQDARSAKERRRTKLDKMNQRDSLWKNFESAEVRDIRTPEQYFTSREKTERSLANIKRKLEDLQVHLQKLRTRGGTPAEKQLVDDELVKVKKTKAKQDDLKHSSAIINSISVNDEIDETVDMVKEELDRRIYKRVEPYLKLAGKDMERQIFGG